MQEVFSVSNEVAAELGTIGDGVLDALRERLRCTILLRGNRLTIEGDEPLRSTDLMYPNWRPFRNRSFGPGCDRVLTADEPDVAPVSGPCIAKKAASATMGSVTAAMRSTKRFMDGIVPRARHGELAGG